jgi:hypothetical protein
MRPYHGNHFSHVLVSLAHRDTNPRIHVIESLLQQTDIKLRGSLDTQVVVARSRIPADFRCEYAREGAFWYLVVRGGMEPPTRGFSVPCVPSR